MEKKIEYKTSNDKLDWAINHVLSKEQLAQLIRNKIERATLYHNDAKKVLALVGRN